MTVQGGRILASTCKPVVAGKQVPRRLISKWYKMLKNSGFTEIECFNAHYDVDFERPLLCSVTTNISKLKIKSNNHEKDFWYAADAFLWRWHGWPKMRQPFARRIWELFCAQELTRKGISHQVSDEYGRKISVRLVDNYRTKLTKQLQIWLDDLYRRGLTLQNVYEEER